MSIVVLGSINMDLVVEAPRLPRPGETLRATRYRSFPGGKGANQAVAVARQGGSARLIGRVGNDEFGPQLVDELKRAGVDVSGVAIDSDAPTGTAHICVTETGESTILTIGGANHRVGSSELSALAKALPEALLLLVQLEVPLDVVVAAVEMTREAGVAVMLDPAPARDLPSSLYDKLTWITPNALEAEALTGTAVTSRDNANRAAEDLLARGATHVVVTLGVHGCVYAGPDGAFAVDAPSVEVVDPVAAGDAFNGALAAALASGVPIPAALQRACEAGAQAVTRAGAQPSIPSRIPSGAPGEQGAR